MCFPWPLLGISGHLLRFLIFLHSYQLKKDVYRSLVYKIMGLSSGKNSSLCLLIQMIVPQQEFHYQAENSAVYLSGFGKKKITFSFSVVHFSICIIIIIIYSFILKCYISIYLSIYPQNYLSILLSMLFTFMYYFDSLCFSFYCLSLLIHFHFLHPSTNIYIHLPIYLLLTDSLFSFSIYQHMDIST